LGTGRVGRWIRLIDMYKYEYTIGEQLFGTFNIYSAHNNYLAILLQLGLTGLFIFLILYIRFFSKLLKVYRQIRTAEVYIGIILSVQIFVYAMSGHPFYYTNILWYLMLFFALNNLVYSHRTNYLSNNDYA
jgi:O-antigen ligase